MFFLKARINNVNVKMLVDSGAQKSIMPRKIAILCNLDNLIDRKCKGEVAGICSKQSIIGKIHLIDLQLPIDNDDEKRVELPCGFTVIDSNIALEDDEINIIFGLDMLVSYGAVIDFKNRKMIIDGYNFYFLTEDEKSKLY